MIALLSAHLGFVSRWALRGKVTVRLLAMRQVPLVRGCFLTRSARPPFGIRQLESLSPILDSRWIYIGTTAVWASARNGDPKPPPH